jgi:hypothetical protein
MRPTVRIQVEFCQNTKLKDNHGRKMPVHPVIEFVKQYRKRKKAPPAKEGLIRAVT